MSLVTSFAKGAALGVGLGTLSLAAMKRRHGLRVRGKTAIVTGASRGLGRAVARELVRRGCKRIGICARTLDDINDAADELVRAGAEEVYAEVCDLRDEEAATRFVVDAWSRLGPIDLFVANAGTITVAPVAVLEKRDFDEAIESLLYTALNPTLALLPGMRARRSGTLAYITSIGGRVGVPHLAPYCTAKFAEVGLAESLRAELASDGIHVLNAVPGLMRTGSHIHARFKGDSEKEYAWFGSFATAPLASIDADRAARRIVSAIERGDAEVTFTPSARLARKASVLVPNLFTTAMRIFGRLLPRAPTTVSGVAQEGATIQATSASPSVRAVATRSREMAERHGQI